MLRLHKKKLLYFDVYLREINLPESWVQIKEEHLTLILSNSRFPNTPQDKRSCVDRYVTLSACQLAAGQSRALELLEMFYYLVVELWETGPTILLHLKQRFQ